MKKNIFSRAFYKNSLSRIMPVLFFMFFFHWLWIIVVNPVPSGDGQSLLYNPLQSYLHLSAENRFSHHFITQISHNQDRYPSGFSILGFIIAKSGLARLFMHEPFYYTFFMLIPLSAIFAVHPWQKKRLALGCLLLFSFPPIQISLRSFSLHGFNVTFSLAGVIMFIKGWQRKSPALLFLGAGCLWFSAILKHLGLWLAMGFLFSLILWSTIRKKHLLKSISFSFIFILLCLPWYPINGFLFYIKTLSDFQNFPYVKLCGTSALIILVLTLVGSIKNQGKKPVPHCFANGLMVFLIFNISVWCPIIHFDSQLPKGLNLQTILIMSCGYAILLLSTHFFKLHSERGFFLLFTYVSLLNAAILYFSRFGNNPAVWYFPACMSMYMTMREIKNDVICITLICFFVLISNFLPPFVDLMEDGSRIAGLRHPEGWNTFPDHHLSWQKSELRPLREEIYNILGEHQFINEKHNTGLSRFMDGHLIEQSGLFYHSWYLPFPVLRTLEFEKINQLKGLSKQEDIENIFNDWLKNGLFAYIIAADPKWSKDPLFGQGINFYAASKNDLLKILSHENPTIERDVECFFWDYLQKNKRLENNYNLFVIGKPKPRFQLYLFKDILRKKNAGKNFHKKRLQSLIEY